MDKWLKTLLVISTVLFFLMLGNPSVWAENPWGMGIDLGFLADTVDDTIITMNFQGDYYFDSNFSIGPQLLLSTNDNLTQLTFAGVARYHIALGTVRVIPFGGLGFVYADLDRGDVDDTDVSYSFPLGATAAFQINQNFSIASTLIFTFQDIDLDNRKNNDNFNIGMLFGFRFHP